MHTCCLHFLVLEVCSRLGLTECLLNPFYFLILSYGRLVFQERKVKDQTLCKCRLQWSKTVALRRSPVSFSYIFRTFILVDSLKAKLSFDYPFLSQRDLFLDHLTLSSW